MTHDCRDGDDTTGGVQEGGSVMGRGSTGSLSAEQ